ncbi:uncharacterized protein GGS22DRAFT_41626 [Annulohypoxylon maeteangense]|uniref:uncharacterized protein n=1 Tax=Annulohypoxylon maeteangense TaxID=1927788 RepID=UPI0020077C19|nr:uncharacterized protein GGS22DRAFT_41626 [Annulohypoxylon maeteangense]KAI0882840.1 hypothetical protein GGS22DRAFT_41626 [Annulohypoxylon maeteangense]
MRKMLIGKIIRFVLARTIRIKRCLGWFGLVRWPMALSSSNFKLTASPHTILPDPWTPPSLASVQPGRKSLHTPKNFRYPSQFCFFYFPSFVL